MAVETLYEHIVRNEKGAPVIAEANFKVEQVVLDHIVYGWSPEAIKIQHPQLSMGQIHAALAYYWDHKAEMDSEIKRGYEYAERMRRAEPLNPFVEKLREIKRLNAD